MSRITGPLLSIGASGQIAKTQVYGTWKGIPYARRYTSPSNPQSAEQTKTRTAFRYLNGLYKLGSADLRAPWDAAAKGRPLTGRNMLTKTNLPLLRDETTNDAFVASPGNGGGLPPAAAVSAGSAGTVTVTMTEPDLPSGWAISKAVLVVLPSVNPQTDEVFKSYTATDAATPFAPAVAGLAAGDYVWSAYFVFTKPDGSTVYGPSISGTDTAT